MYEHGLTDSPTLHFIFKSVRARTRGPGRRDPALRLRLLLFLFATDRSAGVAPRGFAVEPRGHHELELLLTGHARVVVDARRAATVERDMSSNLIN